jgi:hypothetical protein
VVVQRFSVGQRIFNTCGFLITGRILKELPRKGIVHLMAICYAIIRTGYYPIQWKVAQIIMTPKPGKPANEVA